MDQTSPRPSPVRRQRAADLGKDSPGFPRGVPYIVTMEACERFSYYGVLSILTLYLKNDLQLGGDDAKFIVHVFKMAVYFLPLAGAWLADRWIGRYGTILGLSAFYCLGHALLALLGGTTPSVCTGLALIAMGAGGIKPCVSAFVGDQFTREQKDGLSKVYGLFYWCINLGALFAFALVPLIRDHRGYAWAFAVPGIFMAFAAFAFGLGSPHYIKNPSERGRRRQARETMDDQRRDPETAIEGSQVSRGRVVARIALVLLPVPVFWALFEQINTSWVLQGERLQPFSIGGYRVDAERIQSVSALLVLIWVPLLTLVIYPWAGRRGLRPTPLRRMGVGMVFAALSFVICGWLEHRVESGQTVSLAWQVVPYVVLELGEVMVSTTGLEFAYSQAPPTLKSVVMSLWLLTTSLGNLLVAVITQLNSTIVHASGAAEFLFYAGLMLAVAAVFALLARSYQRHASSSPQPASHASETS